jgi:hypothetical protein
MTPVEPDPAPGKVSFMRTMKIVAWGFFGVRKGSASRQESGKLNPVHVVIAGVLGAAIFVVVLVSLVRFALSRVA